MEVYFYTIQPVMNKNNTWKHTRTTQGGGGGGGGAETKVDYSESTAKFSQQIVLNFYGLNCFRET